MLLTLTTTNNPATGLGYLLHKNQAQLHSFELSFGKAHVFYPEATTERCTAALLLDVDPLGLVRGKRGQHEGETLDQHVNDRPYVGEEDPQVGAPTTWAVHKPDRRSKLVDGSIYPCVNIWTPYYRA